MIFGAKAESTADNAEGQMKVEELQNSRTHTPLQANWEGNGFKLTDCGLITEISSGQKVRVIERGSFADLNCANKRNENPLWDGKFY